MFDASIPCQNLARLKSILLIGCMHLLLLHSELLCQSGDAFKHRLRLKHLGLEHGLSQSSILCTLQDSEGFMWFGTRDGLNKYDGYNFKTYRNQSDDSLSISHNRVNCLFTDSKNRLWIGTENGLNLYQSSTDNFKRIKWPAFEDQAIVHLTEDPYGDIIFATKTSIHRLSKDGIVTPVYESFITPPDTSVYFTDLFYDSERILWVSTSIGVYRQSKDQSRFNFYAFPVQSVETVTNTERVVVYEDRQRRIWLGYGNGLALFKPQKDTFEDFHAALRTPVQCITEDYLGNLWIGGNDGLYRINKKNESIDQFAHVPHDFSSLKHNTILSLFEDKSRNLWIGTQAGGISFLDRNYDEFRLYASSTHSKMSGQGAVSGFAEDQFGNLWIGKEGSGLLYLDRNTGELTEFRHNPSRSNSLSTNEVTALLIDHAENLWVGTGANGLNHYDTKKGTFTHINTKSTKGKGPSNYHISTLLEGPNQKIWVGTAGNGVYVVDPSTLSFQPLPSDSKNIGHTIYDFHLDLEGKILIGSNSGLTRVDPTTYQSIGIKGHQVLLEGTKVLSIFEERKNRLWLGTEGQGLFKYSIHNNTFMHFGLDDGLPNEVIYGVIRDYDNNLWLSTNNGLCQFDIYNGTIPESRIKNYDFYDGLQSNEFNYGAYLQSRSGELIFGGTQGFNIFNPQIINNNLFPPPVIITGFSIKNKPVRIETLQVSLDENLSSERSVVLTHDQNIIGIDFVALNYAQPQKNQYAYRLEGFEENWNYIGNKRSATYTNLNHGKYVFKVKASNEDLLWNELGTSMYIEILPPPWKTWWAYLLYAISVVTTFSLIRKYARIRNRERMALKTERLEKEKIEEVNQMKLRFFTNISHEFRTPLTLILDPLERLIKKNQWDNHSKKQLKVMHRNAGILLRLINQLLEFRKHESGKLELTPNRGDLVSFIRETALAFEEQAKQHQIHFEVVTHEEEIIASFDAEKLEEVIFNLLSNAFKFTADDGKIIISILRKKEADGSDAVLIQFEDNGVGMSPDLTRHIFDRFYQLNNASNSGLGTGIGLALTKALVELHEGTIEVQSQPGVGSVFSISMPLINEYPGKSKIAAHSKESVEQDVPIKQEELKQIADSNNDPDDKAPTLNQSDPKTYKLLIVEDNKDVSAYIKDVFGGNYKVYEAHDGIEGLNLSHQVIPDIIISDVMMPEMDGISFCQHIKKDLKTSHIPVLLLTAKASHSSQKIGLESGADDYISKPFSSELLELKVSNILKSRKELRDRFKKDIILQPEELTATSPDEEFLKKAIGLVEKHMADMDFNISLLLDHVGMSRSVLYRKIKALTDQSPTGFVRSIRLKRAAQLLSQNHLNVSEVAYSVGISDIKYFRTSFKQMFGINPSEYRKINTIKEKPDTGVFKFLE